MAIEPIRSQPAQEGASSASSNGPSPQGALLSGSMAYYTFLSLLPLIMVAAFVLGTLSHSSQGVEAALITAIERIVPGVQGRECSISSSDQGSRSGCSGSSPWRTGEAASSAR